MRKPLQLHPNSDRFAATQVEVEIARLNANRLALTYVVTGKMSDLLFQSAVTAVRSDELWRHTCFEAFVRASSGTEYYELNFAPSTQWAAYRFNSYRAGMTAALDVNP